MERINIDIGNLLKYAAITSTDPSTEYYLYKRENAWGKIDLEINLNKPIPDDFSIAVTCSGDYGDEITEKHLDEVGRAITYAAKDFCDKDSYVFKELLANIVNYSETPYLTLRFYFTVVVIAICRKMYNDTHSKKIENKDLATWTFEAFSKGADYFRFSLPKCCGDNLWSPYDINGIENNMPGMYLNINELGPVNILNYVLGPYYYHLATYCPNPDEICKRPLNQWKFGKA